MTADSERSRANDACDSHCGIPRPLWHTSSSPRLLIIRKLTFRCSPARRQLDPLYLWRDFFIVMYIKSLRRARFELKISNTKKIVINKPAVLKLRRSPETGHWMESCRLASGRVVFTLPIIFFTPPLFFLSPLLQKRWASECAKGLETRPQIINYKTWRLLFCRRRVPWMRRWRGDQTKSSRTLECSGIRWCSAILNFANWFRLNSFNFFSHSSYKWFNIFIQIHYWNIHTQIRLNLQSFLLDLNSIEPSD